MKREIEVDYDFNKIGYNAKIIDTQMTTKNRMKLKKSTIQKIFAAITFYMLIMIFFIFVL
jgi:hypothetical protein